MQTVKIEVKGLVADVSGTTLIINVGKKDGVKVGDKLIISRQVRTVKDPATGKVIKSVEDKIGDATVTDADNDSATVTFSGAGPAKVGRRGEESVGAFPPLGTKSPSRLIAPRALYFKKDIADKQQEQRESIGQMPAPLNGRFSGKVVYSLCIERAVREVL